MIFLRLTVFCNRLLLRPNFIHSMRYLFAEFLFVLVLAGAPFCQIGVVSHPSSTNQAWRIEGVVTDSFSNPIEGVEVRAEAREGTSAITDKNGRYILKGVKAGKYYLFGKKSGYSPARVKVVQLMPGIHITLNLRMNREAVLSGRVLHRDGMPFPAVQIEVWGKEFHGGRPFFTLQGRATTDKLGKYSVAGLSEGDYYVGAVSQRVEIQSYTAQDTKQAIKRRMAYPPILYPGAPSFDEAGPIRLHNSQQREGIDLILEKVPTFCASGVVSLGDSFSEPENATLMLVETSHGWESIIGGGSVSPGQKFTICNLVPNVGYRLISQLWSKNMELHGFAERNFEGSAREPEEEYPLDLGIMAMQSGRPVSGTITTDSYQENESFPTSLMVALEAMTSLPLYANESREAKVSSDGQFTLENVFPYAHVLRMLYLPTGYYVKQATCGHLDLLQTSWQPGCGEVKVVLGLNAGTISGQILDEKGQPFDDADVILVSKEDDINTSIVVQPVLPGGQFQFPSIKPGHYKIIAIAGIPDGDAHNIHILANYLSYSKELDISAKSNQYLTLTALSFEQ